MVRDLWNAAVNADDSTKPRHYLGVMVSSTFTNLQEHRAALMRAIEGQGLHAVAMEQDAALPASTVVDASLRKVRDASAYVGIISHLYGQIPESDDNPERLSLTELEFREARRLARPILIFIMGPDHPVRLAEVERNPEKIRKLNAFLEDVKRAVADAQVHRVYREFNDLADFSVAATQSVAELRRHLDAQAGPATGTRVPDPGERDGIPAAPQIYAEPRYVGTHVFVGRAAQLATLSDWAEPAEPHSILLFEAIGGTGKSMLTWEWTTGYAPGVRGDWAGRFWYSFYEKGAVMADFCRRALAYMTGRPLAAFSGKKQPELSDLLLRQLQSRPWLLVLDGLERVLVAYHRYDAAQLADEEAGRTDEIGHRDPCAAIRPEDDDLLRHLAAATPSKILITSRLVPHVLLNTANQPIPGVLHERLPGLRPADAEALLRSCGVHGTSEAMRAFLQRHCDCHPLVTGIVAGLINDYLPARGHFDAWAADPEHGGRLDLAELDLVQKRNHILHAALNALPAADRQLLSTLALVSEAVDVETLSAFNPHERDENHPGNHQGWRTPPEVAAARRKLARTVTDLERRGLLQYDRQARRYDLHPVVRALAAGGLPSADLQRLGQQVVDHFSQRGHGLYQEAESVDDLRNGLTVVRTLLRLGRVQAAMESYRGDLADALLRLEAHAEALSLLHPFFAHGWTAPAAGLADRDVSFLATCVAVALSEIGELDQALTLHGLALEIDLNRKTWANARMDITNMGRALYDQNRLARAEHCLRLAVEMAELLKDPRGIFMARLSLFERLGEAGRVADAERTWQSLDLRRSWDRTGFYRGQAELCYGQFQLDRGLLTEDHLTHAELQAHASRNRRTVRRLRRLRGDWLMRREEWAGAVDILAGAVRMAREAAISDSWAETQLALARLRLGQLPAASREADRLAAHPNPNLAHLPLAELWLAIGDTQRATEHALAAYRYAWADGEPYVRRSALERAARLLATLGVAIPTLAGYDPATDPKLRWEDLVAAAIDTLRAQTKRNPAAS